MRVLKENIRKHVELLCERYPILRIVESDIVAVYQVLEESYKTVESCWLLEMEALLQTQSI